MSVMVVVLAVLSPGFRGREMTDSGFVAGSGPQRKDFHRCGAPADTGGKRTVEKRRKSEEARGHNAVRVFNP